MRKISTFVPATIAGVLFAGMACALTVSTETQDPQAPAMDQAGVMVAETCVDLASVTASQAQSWHDALSNKRIQDRALVLAAGGAAEPCNLISQSARPLP